MQIPLQVTFRNIDHSDFIEAAVKEKMEKLEHFADSITGCKVIIEAPHKHHQKGVLYRVKIDITVPGKEIVVNHHSDDHHAHEDVYVAIRDAFNAAKRQLEDFVRQRRGDVKTHATASGTATTE
jgi:ribosomal subunit interface protein